MRNYEGFDKYEGLFDQYPDAALEDINVDERLLCIHMAIENACELLEKLVECAKDNLKEVKKEGKEKKEKKLPKFVPGKIGTDVCEENSQQDVIARIFGNKSTS